MDWLNIEEYFYANLRRNPKNNSFLEEFWGNKFATRHGLFFLHPQRDEKYKNLNPLLTVNESELLRWMVPLIHWTPIVTFWGKRKKIKRKDATAFIAVLVYSNKATQHQKDKMLYALMNSESIIYAWFIGGSLLVD